MKEFEQTLEERYENRLLKIKYRNNQYLPISNNNTNNLMMSHKKLNKSKSQFLNLSRKVETNRKNINSVKKALIKPRPADYYEKGKYLYDRQIEKIQKLYLDNLKSKNDVLEEKLKVMKKKMVKIPLYILNGRKKKKKVSFKIEDIYDHEQENGEEQNNENQEEDAHNIEDNKYGDNRHYEEQKYYKNEYGKSHRSKRDYYKSKKNYGYEDDD